MTGGIQVNMVGMLPLKRQMQLLAMPASMRRRLMYRVAKKVIVDSKKRVRTQTDLQGRAYQARARKRKGGRKMLSKMAKELKVINNSSVEAVIGFRSPVLAKIAAKQQYGYRQRVSARKLPDAATGRDAPATRKQAKALRELGYEIKTASGKGKKRPSLKWVTQNMKVGQAGAAIKYLRVQAGETIKQSWTTTLPARSFLGATSAEISQYIELIFKQMQQEITHAAR